VPFELHKPEYGWERYVDGVDRLDNLSGWQLPADPGIFAPRFSSVKELGVYTLSTDGSHQGIHEDFLHGAAAVGYNESRAVDDAAASAGHGDPSGPRSALTIGPHDVERP
jgi:hypothetical protein